MKDWPAWFYGPGGEARIFERKEDVPNGWHDAPFSGGMPNPARSRKGRS